MNAFLTFPRPVSFAGLLLLAVIAAGALVPSAKADTILSYTSPGFSYCTTFDGTPASVTPLKPCDEYNLNFTADIGMSGADIAAGSAAANAGNLSPTELGFFVSATAIQISSSLDPGITVTGPSSQTGNLWIAGDASGSIVAFYLEFAIGPIAGEPEDYVCYVGPPGRSFNGPCNYAGASEGSGWLDLTVGFLGRAGAGGVLTQTETPEPAGLLMMIMGVLALIVRKSSKAVCAAGESRY